jgi:ATP-binding cassette subfamily B (MDR/TAP) protein 1
MLGSTQLGNALPFITVVATAQGAASTIFDVIETKPKIDAYSRQGLQLSNPKGKVAFDKICFRYPSRPEITVSPPRMKQIT